MILIGTPYKKKFGTNGPTPQMRRAHHRWVLPTDRGDMLTEEAAQIVGLTTSAMVTRVNRVMSGIISAADLFAPPGQAKCPRKVIDNRIVTDEYCSVPDEDAGKYAHLSGRLRDHNLRKLTSLGKWEARHYGQTGG